MKRFELYLTERQLAALTRQSKSTGLSIAELVRRAIDAALET